jgi:hypothetical protein
MRLPMKNITQPLTVAPTSGPTGRDPHLATPDRYFLEVFFMRAGFDGRRVSKTRMKQLAFVPSVLLSHRVVAKLMSLASTS